VFKHLLVPLDGSRLAEAALPVAASLAQALGASVTLVHVVEENPPQEVHGERHLSGAGQAHAYLDEVASRAFPAGLCVQSHVHKARVIDVARSIMEHGDELAPDLIVMCTHGQSGLRTRLFGSIAQQVIALGNTPVLLIQPSGARPVPPFACRRVMVPLDGQADHEQGLPAAAALARAYGAQVLLVRVVPTLSTLAGQQAASGRFLPGAMATLLDLREEDAEAYVQQQVSRLQAQGLEAQADVQRGDPAKVIAGTARKMHACVVVLGTHGKTGMEAFWSGSIAPEVAGRSRVPLLLVPVRE
jgi:nucleotide-binding universal stress UspA family protein